MAKHATADIRNVALIGGPNAGKTTLLEAMLHAAGALARRGKVTDGSSLVDFDPDEKEKKHTLFLKVFHCAHRKRELNLLDTPGYPDFIGEALSVLNAVETAALCVNAPDGVTFHAHRLWTEAGKAGRGRIVLVNRIDADNVDVDKLLAQIAEVLGPTCVPVNLPIGVGSKASGVVDLLRGSANAPAAMKEAVAAAQEKLVDAIVTLDEQMMESYLETGEAPLDKLVPLMARGIASETLTPVLFTAAEKDIGVAELLEFLAEDTPSPEDGPYFSAHAGEQADGELVEMDPREHPEFCARVFKTISDPYVGRLTLVRVLTGAVDTEQPFVNCRVGKVEKMGHILRPQGKDQEKVDHAIAGDVVALAKMETIETNDTLCTEKARYHVTPPEMPKPMVGVAVAPKSRNDEQKLSVGLRKLTAEDQTFVVDRDEQTGELVVRGVSNLHIDTLLHRLSTHFKVEVTTHVPKVPLRETIATSADGHYRHKKQTGGRGQFGEVFLRVEPRERGSGFEFADDTYGGSIPRQFLPAIEKGIHEQMGKGVVAGYPVVDVKVVVTDGKAHDVDSDEHSFKIAGARAFRDAFEKARPVLLEPIVDLDVAVPSRAMGDITSDLNGRRGRISGMDSIGDTQIIKAKVPLKEVQTYAPDLRSLTQGEGSFTFAFSHYDLVPHKVAEDLMAAHRAGRKEEEE